MNHEALREHYEAAGQGQVFRFWNRLDVAGKARLAEEAASIDLEEINRLAREMIHGPGGPEIDWSRLAPAPTVALPEHGGNPGDWKAAREAGEAALRAGRVGAFVVAGGQGTRLGFDGPKGTFPVTPVRRATLFQVFAEKIRHAQNRYGQTIPWLIMTSPANDAATRAYFGENDFLGLAREAVFFFQQGSMPAVDREGKILLAEPGAIAMSPDGHGGSLRALVRSGATARLRERGIDTLSYWQVDNPLVGCLDPAFLGFHLLAGSEMSSRMLPKAYPEEKVGVFGLLEGNTCVVEYSDLPMDLMQARNPDGSLRYDAGSIAIHVMDRAFVEKVGGGHDPAMRLPFHRADKKIPTVDAEGRPVRPEKPNGIKFEMFVFDALPFARHPVIVECRREDTFSPVKNAEGLDSPQTCREAQLRQAARWLRAAGEALETDTTGLPALAIEVSPLFAVEEAEFCEKWRAWSGRPVLRDGLVI